MISGNCGSGINLSGSGAVASGNTIEGNLIGTDIGGTLAVPNAGAGIKLDDERRVGTRNTVIGGVGTASGNVIAMNGGDGVEVAGAESVENTIRSNSIFGNGGLGIDLGESGITPNDPVEELDADTGSNNLQNFPHLDVESTTTTVSGDLQSASENVYRIDVYASPGCDPLGSGEGKTRVASFDMTTEEDGDVAFGPRLSGPARRDSSPRPRLLRRRGHLRVLAVRERQRWRRRRDAGGRSDAPSGN